MRVTDYAVILESDGLRWNYATTKLVKVENNGDGDKKVVFLPRLLKVSTSDTAISFESQPPIPTVGIELWDGVNEIKDAIRNDEKSYEAIQASFLFLDESGEEVQRFVGYLTDIEFEENVISGTIRMDEDSNGAVELEKFSFDTFQFFTLFKPVDVDVVSDFNLVNDTPWEIFKLELQRTKIGKQEFRCSDTVGADSFNIVRTNPLHGLPGNYTTSFIKLGTTKNIYTQYLIGEVFFLKLGLDPIPAVGGYTVEIRIYDNIATAFKVFSYAVLAGNTYDTIMEGLAANIDADPNFSAEYISDTGDLYVQADPADVDDTYGSVADGNLILVQDPLTVGSEKRLAPAIANLFDTSSNGSAFKIAILGDAQFQTTEYVGYTHCLQGQIYVSSLNGTVYNSLFDCYGSYVEDGETIFNADVYYLSGIPKTGQEDPQGLLATMTALDATITNTAELLAKYGIQYPHTYFEMICPNGAIDKIYVKANGLTVYDTNADKSTVGYINVGATLENNEANTRQLLFNRYKVSEIYYSVYDDIRNDGTVYDEILKLEIHSRPGFHDYAVNTKQTRWELPDDVKTDTKVLLADFKLTASYFDVLIDNIDDERWSQLASTSTAIYRDQLRDRYKGQRIDMLDDYSDFVSIIAKSANGNEVEDIAKENANITNNASGMFAVCTGSQIVLDDPAAPTQIFERIYFYVDSKTAVERLWIPQDADTGGSSGVGIERKYNIKSENGRENFYLNYFSFNDDIVDASQYENFFDALKLLAREFFAGRTYRTFFNPVPENSQDLGRAFPIVYGTVNRAKVIHTVSKKVIGEEVSAGDDVYIYASHPCEVRTPADLKIELLEETNGKQINRTERDYDANLRFDIVRSPFPNYVEDHWELDSDPSINGSFPRLKYYGRLDNPYHEIGRFETNRGNLHYGFRLLGDQWKPRVGKLDRRYPIRNGVGTTPLYVTLSGWLDKDGAVTGIPGALVEHPLDIIHHFLRTYGEYPYNEDFININSKERVKSRTREFYASVLIDEDIKISDLIFQLCKQFGIKYFIKNGQVNFAIPDVENVNYGKPLSEGLNLITGLQEGGYGYKNVYNEIEIRYNFNIHTGNFESVYTLNADNNVFCAKADRSRGGKKKFSIDAKYVTSDWVAAAVADFYARTLCRNMIKFKCKAAYANGIVFSPGDVIPVTSRKNDLTQAIMVVNSVKTTDRLMELELAYFT